MSNVLQGIGLIEKQSKNQILWRYNLSFILSNFKYTYNENFLFITLATRGAVEQNQIQQMKEMQQNLLQMEAELDAKMFEANLKKEKALNSSYAYVDMERVKKVPSLSSSSVCTFRNPKGPLYVNYEVCHS